MKKHITTIIGGVLLVCMAAGLVWSGARIRALEAQMGALIMGQQLALESIAELETDVEDLDAVYDALLDDYIGLGVEIATIYEHLGE